MKHRLMWLALGVVVTFSAQDLLACGDKFLMSGRGTRYQRPKNARAASVLIYADPASELAMADTRFEPLLKQKGHRATTVRTFEQLSNVIAAGQFDVIIAASSAAGKIEELFAGASNAAVVLAFENAPKSALLLRAIDTAVLQHDQRQRNLP
jgi:hypothetical protein